MCAPSALPTDLRRLELDSGSALPLFSSLLAKALPAARSLRQLQLGRCAAVHAAAGEPVARILRSLPHLHTLTLGSGSPPADVLQALRASLPAVEVLTGARYDFALPPFLGTSGLEDLLPLQPPEPPSPEESDYRYSDIEDFLDFDGPMGLGPWYW